MKSSPLRLFAALLLTLGLAACGGKATYTINGTFINSIGTITPLANAGLVLVNNGNGDTVAVPAGATTFTFPKTINYGDPYDIEVQTPPNHMNCVMSSNIDSGGHTATIAVYADCVQNIHFLSGTVYGLPTTVTDTPLTLTNGSNNTPLIYDPTVATFTFPAEVTEGTTYGVTVLTQPTGYTCSVVSGQGIVGATDITNVVVNCVPN
ncbi:MAG TPA: hypothetical protein VGP06_02450 [Janthinobacterium sp.]|nr:hypothetical protein [Janthinobacterium sp.]